MGFHRCDGSTRNIRDNPSHPRKSAVTTVPISDVSISRQPFGSHPTGAAHTCAPISDGGLVMTPPAKKPSAYLKITGLLTLTMLLSPSAWAQLRIVGAISGTVLDTTGAVIADAKVALKDTKTGVTKEASSTHGGTFLFPDLATGLYEVTVTAQGFKTATLTNISVSTNQTADVRVSLELGAASETVTVNATDLQALETSSQLVATTLSPKTVTQLPVGNRSNVLALARLAPGASPPTPNTSTRYNNLAGGAVNVTVDGINDASNGFKSGGTVFFM